MSIPRSVVAEAAELDSLLTKWQAITGASAGERKRVTDALTAEAASTHAHVLHLARRLVTRAMGGEKCGHLLGTYDLTCAAPAGHEGGHVGPFYAP